MSDQDLQQLRIHFTEAIYQICDDNGGSVTSWKRSRVHNWHEGGKENSLHLTGLGADLVFDTVNQRAAALHDIKTAGLHYLEESDHVHVQALPAKPG